MNWGFHRLKERCSKKKGRAITSREIAIGIPGETTGSSITTDSGAVGSGKGSFISLSNGLGHHKGCKATTHGLEAS